MSYCLSLSQKLTFAIQSRLSFYPFVELSYVFTILLNLTLSTPDKTKLFQQNFRFIKPSSGHSKTYKISHLNNRFLKFSKYLESIYIQARGPNAAATNQVKLRPFLGQTLRLGQARRPSAAATCLTLKTHVQSL